jgi:hypothetical protein
VISKGGVMAIQEQIYNELGENFRVSLRWREKLFGGFFIILGSLALAFFKLHSAQNRAFALLMPFFGAIVSVAFFLLDVRCHDVLKKNYRVGADLEHILGYYGSYRLALERPMGVISHTAVLEAVYMITGALCIGFGIFYQIRYEPLKGLNILSVLWSFTLPLSGCFFYGSIDLLKMPDSIWFRRDSQANVVIITRALAGFVFLFLGMVLFSLFFRWSPINL